MPEVLNMLWRKRKRLPWCDELFVKFFGPWHDDESRQRRGYKGTRPDLEQIAEPDAPLDNVQILTAEGQSIAKNMIAKMFLAAKNDLPSYLAVREPVSLVWVDAFDKFYDRSKIQTLIDRSDPSKIGNDYLVVTCEFGVVLGEVLRQELPELLWLHDMPYWESALYFSGTGSRVNVFHWAVKKMSEYGVDDGFAAKVRACVNLLKGRFEGQKE
jgi:hypothetical protein